MTQNKTLSGAKGGGGQVISPVSPVTSEIYLSPDRREPRLENWPPVFILMSSCETVYERQIESKLGFPKTYLKSVFNLLMVSARSMKLMNLLDIRKTKKITFLCSVY